MTVGELNVEIGAKLTKLDKGLNEMNRKLGKTDKTVKKSTSSVRGFGKALVVAFSAAVVSNLGRKVVDVTAEFQKLEAVLTNTLGSSSSAKVALMQIQEFASTTPFAVSELTQSFVKLANQGFTPTVKQMRLLGDVAASTGKSFDQLTEAIIDAQTGEFERLKEFGIRAKSMGDKVAFTFKGVTTTVDNTGAALRNYVLGLGELEGVSGSTAAISATLGGKISNLGDNMEMLFNTIGGQGDSAMGKFLDNLNSMIQLVTQGIKSVRQIKEEVALMNLGDQMAEDKAEVEALALRYLDLGVEIDKNSALIRAASDISEQYNTIVKNGTAENIDQIQKQSKALKEYVNTLRLAAFQQSQTMGGGRDQQVAVNLPSKGIPSVLDTEVLNNAVRGIKEVEDGYKDVNKAISTGSSFTDGLANSLSDAFMSGINGAQSFGDALKDMLIQLAKAILKSAILATILSIISGGTTSLGGAFKQLLGLGKSLAGGIPGRATGGPVGMGRPYMVGERGPELFVPNSSGSIVPNGAMGGGGGMLAARIVGAGDDLILYLEQAQNRRKNFM